MVYGRVRKTGNCWIATFVCCVYSVAFENREHDLTWRTTSEGGLADVFIETDLDLHDDFSDQS